MKPVKFTHGDFPNSELLLDFSEEGNLSTVYLEVGKTPVLEDYIHVDTEGKAFSIEVPDTSCILDLDDIQNMAETLTFIHKVIEFLTTLDAVEVSYDDVADNQDIWIHINL